MKSIILALSVLVLTACGTNKPQTEVLVKNQYIVRTAPDQLKKLPPYPEPLVVESATQTDLARWINRTEGYIYDLESMISVLINFYEKPVSAVETAAANTSLTASGAATTQPETAYVDPAQRRVLDIK